MWKASNLQRREMPKAEQGSAFECTSTVLGITLKVACRIIRRYDFPGHSVTVANNGYQTATLSGPEGYDGFNPFPVKFTRMGSLADWNNVGNKDGNHNLIIQHPAHWFTWKPE
jgi:hypothetical protein